MRTAASIFRLTRPIAHQQSTLSTVHLTAAICRRWYWPSTTSMSGAVSPSTHTISPPSHVFHVLLVRHAESFNNVLAEQLQRQHGDTPYNPHAGRDLVLAYDRARKIDPDLSQLGMKQANLLPEHPHLMDCRWYELARDGRLRVLTSPMLRTVQTSLPLLQQINAVQQNYTAATPRTVHSAQYLITSTSEQSLTLPDEQLLASVSPTSLPSPLPYRAVIHPDFCERGGFYSTQADDHGVVRNVRSRGMTRSQLEAAYGKSHMADKCKEDGWWNEDAEGEEQEDEYFARVERAITYTLTQAALYHQHHHAARQLTPTAASHHDSGSGESHSADYMVVVSHADFIDSFLTRILQIHNHGRPKHCFYASNTSVSHVELSYSPPHHSRQHGVVGGSGGVVLPKDGAVLADVLRDYEVRIRCVNSLPRSVPAGDPPADDTVNESNNHAA